MPLLQQRISELIDLNLRAETNAPIHGHGQAFVARIKDTLNESLVDEESLEFWALAEAITELTLVSVKGMIQHDSLGEEYFEPFGLDRNGNLCNLSLFGVTSNNLLEREEFSGDPSKLASRRAIIVSKPPCKEVINGPRAKAMLLFYDSSGIELQVNNFITIVGLAEPTSPSFASDHSNNLSRIHVLRILPADTNHVTKDDHGDLYRQTLQYLRNVATDTKAVKKILSCLVSRVDSRASGLLASLLIGYYPLNIRVSPSDFSDAIIDRLSKIFTHTSVLRLSPATINGFDFLSTMDYDAGELTQGLLQVPNGSLLFVDERSLQAGKLSERAAKNLQALFDLTRHQQVCFDFGGQAVSVPVNVTIISISHGKSILPIDEWTSIDEPLQHDFDPATITKIASYIQYCRQLGDFQISEEVANLIEMKNSKDENSAILRDPNFFSRALNAARLISNAKGQSSLTMESYEESLEMCLIN